MEIVFNEDYVEDMKVHISNMEDQLDILLQHGKNANPRTIIAQLSVISHFLDKGKMYVDNENVLREEIKSLKARLEDWKNGYYDDDSWEYLSEELVSDLEEGITKQDDDQQGY